MYLFDKINKVKERKVSDSMILAVIPKLYIDIAISLVIWIVTYFLIKKVINKYFYFIGSGSLLALAGLFYYLDYKFAAIITIVILLSFIFGILIMCQSELHKLLKNGFASKFLAKQGSSLKENDENKLFVELNKSILELSESKTGAIIVIERDVNLQNYIDDGISVHAPVKCEVLNSIFYEGTPLHDGALIIRGIMIEAAHVFVTPTTRALQGHYGARHRAAIGISEVSDALIIVVSEETGRISFVEHGELETISRDRFTQALSDKIATL